MFIALLLIHTAALAGKITGKVTDEKTGEGVIGATVVLKGTSSGTVTDVDGNYELTVADGQYTIVVKYIGYTAKEVGDIFVKGPKPITVNIVISEAANTQLEEVVVRSSLKKENISALYILQKNNVSVSSGISADLIRRSPDRNTGEVLKRVSGASIQNNKFVIIRGLNERYNAAMINGAQMQSTEPDKKAFSYDVIPSNLIDNIIINKTASAELSGDFAGGVVQVLTKDIPESDFISAGITLGYNTQATFRDFYSNKRSMANTLGFGDRSSRLPSSFMGNYRDFKMLPAEQRLGAARDLGNKYGEVKSIALPNTNLQFAIGRARSLRGSAKLGLVAGVVFRNGFNILSDFERGTNEASGRINSYSKETSYRYSSSTAALVNLAFVNKNTKLTLRNLVNSMYDNNYYQREGFSASSSQQFRLFSSVPNSRRIYSGQLDGDHHLNAKNAKLYWNLSYANMKAGQPDLRTMFYSRPGTLDDNNNIIPDEGKQFALNTRNTRRFFSDLNDNSFGGNFNFSIPFTMGGQKQTLKFGYLGNYKDRRFETRTFQYEESMNFDTLLQYERPDKVFADENISETGYELEDITNPDDQYNANSLLNAAFVMMDNHLGKKFRVSYGVRFESYTQQLKALSRSGSKIDESTTFSDFLPSLNLSYEVSEKSKLRLSASRTVNRPEFRELAPFQFIDYENNWTLVGNPQLKRANVTNTDLRYEFYPTPGEAMTAGVFFKHFENPIESVMDGQSNYDLLIFGYKNAPSATAYGAELEIRKNLSFISPVSWLERLVLGANLTYIHSQVDMSSFGVDKDRPLQGQSPYLANFSVLYNDVKHGLGFSALYNRIGERIAIVGKSDIPTIWEKARNVIDLQVSKSVLNKRGEVKLTVSDLLNQNYLFYWNFDDKNTYSESNDRVFQKYRLGTNVSVGFSYNF